MPTLDFLKSYARPSRLETPSEHANGKEKQGDIINDVSSPTSPTTPTTPITPNTAISSRFNSRASSLFPSTDFRNVSSIEDFTDVKCDIMVNWLHQRQLEAMWTSGGVGEGVVLKRRRDQFIACPETLERDSGGLLEAVKNLNVRVAMTVNTRVVKLFLEKTDMPYVPLVDGLRLQILPDVSYLPSCQKHHFAAFIKDTSFLIVWDDEPKELLNRARRIESQLMEMIWRADEDKIFDEKAQKPETSTSQINSGENSPTDSAPDLAAAEQQISEAPRRVVLNQAFMVALTLTLIIAALGSGWRNIAMEIMADGSWTRMAFLAVAPVQLWLALSFVGSICQILGPVSQVNINSRYYSAKRPRRLIRKRTLPHVTIQCPVYKEGLAAVIEPTVKSVKGAISTYEMQGGTANLFVNDDGMQILSDDEAGARREFYDEHNIGWVARPPHGHVHNDGSTFLRPGKFKKASNMNYALGVSVRVEDKLASVNRHSRWTEEEETEAYSQELQNVLVEDEGLTWADGNVRVGDYILLIDSDTRVPSDCLLDAVSEMEQAPRVAIIQFSSGVMNVTQSFFERGITFFTHLIYSAISFAVASGDIAPFVGHNAVLRWSAVQDVAFPSDEEGKPNKYWSERTVSEDFDMALRLQCAGYLLRFATYSGDGFKEGVSLTVYDELARWEKYAYGCSELIFNPIGKWLKHGPLTTLFRRFVASGMPLPSKVTIMAYVGTYFALASAWWLTLANYFLSGWYIGYLDHYYIDSFQVLFSIVLVFSALGNIALAVFRYRVGGSDKSLPRLLMQNFKWMLMLCIFLGGISMHVWFACVAHLVGWELAWGATAKEAESTDFWQEVPKILHRFKYSMFFAGMVISGTVAMALFVPPLWRITTFMAIFPTVWLMACHIMLPIVLNSGLMMFSW